VISNEEILKSLQDHESRISKIESLFSKPKPATTKEKTSSLANHLLGLRNHGFFSHPKTSEETHTELQEKYHCEENRVAVALLRLANRRLLRKASKMINGKKYQAYVW
jgi:hypothetical protein